MSDHIDRAAEVMDRNFNPDQYPIMAAMFRDYARALDAAGLLVTPAHDAAVAAKALRMSASSLLRLAHADGGGASVSPYEAAQFFIDHADRIEREAGQ